MINLKNPWPLPVLLLLLVLAGVLPAFGRVRVALIAPQETKVSVRYLPLLTDSLPSDLTVLDESLALAAFRPAAPELPFNLTTSEARLIGAAIGCDYFLLVNSGVQRRVSLAKGEYVEAFASHFLVSSRTGRLVWWKLASFDSAREPEAISALADSVRASSLEIAAKIRLAHQTEIGGGPEPKIDEIPEGEAAQGFRAPAPYRRISPKYTDAARLYRVEATVEIVVDIDENGKILRTEIERWAGYGLDESVAEAVRSMNWRPAERNGKKVPIRSLLRYNFRKIEKDD